MKVIPIVIDTLRTIPNGLVKRLDDLEIRKQVKTIQTTALLRSPRIPRRVLETLEDLLSFKHLWKLSGNSGGKNSQTSKIIKINFLMFKDDMKLFAKNEEKKKKEKNWRLEYKQ